MSVVEPIADSVPRLPTCGRIRIGVKTGKAMKAIDTFRFTSPDKDLIDRCAALYGGTVRVWTDPRANPPNQWQVITPINRIPVVLMPGCLSQWWELWSGGGCQRRCDGVTADVAGRNDMESVPCVCAAKGVLECTTQTRINVLLPELPLRGIWMLATKSQNAKHELPGMLAVIDALANGAPLVRAELGVEPRKTISNGQTKNFVVPTISIPQSPLEVAAGDAHLVALTVGGQPEQRALPSPSPIVTPSYDDDIVDAEVLDPALEPLRVRCNECADQYNVDRDRLWHGVCIGADDDITRIEKGISMMEQGTIQPVGFTSDRRVQWVKS